MSEEEREKWILYRHTRDLELALTVGQYMRDYGDMSISTESKQALLDRLRAQGSYSERNASLPLDALNHRINTLCFFMFGYKIKGQDRFLFSPLGNLYYKYVNNPEKRVKIFLTMLWAIQFQHPHSGTAAYYQLYPFRLIYKLLMDQRLNYKLQAYEVVMAVVFTRTAKQSTYDKLVAEILELRNAPDDVIVSRLLFDKHNHVNAAYEWDYYVSNILDSEKVLDRTEGATIIRLQHGETQTYRNITRTTVRIPDNLRQYLSVLLEKYPVDATPLLLNSDERMKEDVIKEIYSFYPDELLKDIGEYDEDIQEILNLPKLIEQYANNNEGTEAYLFEDALEEGFNQFYNVDARKIGGAGQTDVECLYLTENVKFAVDAKSTKNKLSGLNAGRLDGHRRDIGGKYTIVITPRYVPAVRQDIRDTKIVILLAATFAEYLYNHMVRNVREIDYSDINKVILNNLGSDVSQQVSQLTINKFALTDDVLKNS